MAHSNLINLPEVSIIVTNITVIVTVKSTKYTPRKVNMYAKRLRVGDYEIYY